MWLFHSQKSGIKITGNQSINISYQFCQYFTFVAISVYTILHSWKQSLQHELMQPEFDNLPTGRGITLWKSWFTQHVTANYSDCKACSLWLLASPSHSLDARIMWLLAISKSSFQANLHSSARYWIGNQDWHLVTVSEPLIWKKQQQGSCQTGIKILGSKWRRWRIEKLEK